MHRSSAVPTGEHACTCEPSAGAPGAQARGVCSGAGPIMCRALILAPLCRARLDRPPRSSSLPSASRGTKVSAVTPTERGELGPGRLQRQRKRPPNSRERRVRIRGPAVWGWWCGAVADAATRGWGAGEPAQADGHALARGGGHARGEPGHRRPDSEREVAFRDGEEGGRRR